MKITKTIFALGCVLFFSNCNYGQNNFTNQDHQKSNTKISEAAQEGIVYIPDKKFKSYLLSNVAINTNGDNEISTAEANAFTGRIYCFDMGISDLTGIEAFTSLTSLHCGLNRLTSLNINKNKALKTLNCSLNQLTSLNIQNNTNLLELDCSQNKITELNTSNNTQLTELHCFVNKLINLDVSNLKALQILICSTNQLTELDLRNNLSLEMLVCDKNQITSLDLHKNIALKYFFSKNNKLTSLNLNNNHNTLIERIETKNNVNLRCIVVDNPTFSTNNWNGELFQFDEELIFNKVCD